VGHRTAVFVAATILSACQPSVERALPDVPGAATVLLVVLQDDAASVVALELPVARAFAVASDVTVEALFYPCSLAALRLPSGPIPLAGVDGRALPPPTARHVLEPGAPRWRAAEAALSPQLEALRLALAVESPCRVFDVAAAHRVVMPLPPEILRETPTAAAVLDDGSVLVTTAQRRAFIASRASVTATLVPGLTGLGVTAEGLFRRPGDERLWVLGSQLDLYEASPRGEGDFVITATRAAPRGEVQAGRAWLDGTKRGALELWALAQDGSYAGWSEVAPPSFVRCEDCSRLVNAGFALVSRGGDVYLGRRGEALRVRAGRAERLALSLFGGAALYSALEVDAPELGVVIGTSGGRIHHEREGTWDAFVSTLGPPVRVMTRLDEGFVYASDNGEVREYRLGAGLCPPAQAGPVKIRAAFEVGGDLVLIGDDDDEGPAIVSFVPVQPKAPGCPRPELTGR
jgi:hypothetical protein